MGRLVAWGVLPLALVVVTAGAANAQLEPPGPNDPPAPPGSAQFCVDNTFGTASTSVSSVYPTGLVTVSWNVTTDPSCSPRITIDGPGFSLFAGLDMSGSKNLAAPTQLGQISWTLRMTVPSNNTKNLATARTTVVRLPQLSGAAAARDGSGRLVVFRVNSDDTVQRSTQIPQTGGFGDWQPAGTGIRSIAAEANADGRIEVFGIDGTGAVFHSWQTTAGADPPWSAWTPIDTKLTSIAVARNADGRLELFGTHMIYGTVWHSEQVSAGSTNWTAWTSFDAGLDQVAAETNADGRIEFFGTNSAGIWHRWQTAVNSDSWSAWAHLPGTLSTIAMARNNDGRLEIVGLDSTGTLHYATQITAGSADWTDPGTATLFDGHAGPLAVETNNTGRMEIFGVSRNNVKFQHRGQSDPGVNTWTGYTDMVNPVHYLVESPSLLPWNVTVDGVTVNWADRSDNETRFVVQKRDRFGMWQDVYMVPTRNMTDSGVENPAFQYSWTDTDKSVSGQCYRIGAANDMYAGYTDEQCEVRPDPSRFPQVVSGPASQWVVPPWFNGESKHTYNTHNGSAEALYYDTTDPTGVDLSWGSTTAGTMTVAAQGGPILMRGQAVAIAVDGHWIKYGHQDFGVDVAFSDSPVYEWYFLGQNDPSERPFAGMPLSEGSNELALWNSSANAYLVQGHQTWGLDLNWYTVNGSVPPPPPPPPATPGVKRITIYNCKGTPGSGGIDPPRSIIFWTRDLTTGAAYTNRTQVSSDWTSTGCGTAIHAGSGFTFEPPVTGHQYRIQMVDFTQPGCTDDPVNFSGTNCNAGGYAIVGDTNGAVVQSYTG